MFDIHQHLKEQFEFSLKTFGPGDRVKGVLDHISKELKEIEKTPNDLEEWIDLLLLSFDGALRQGFTPVQITEMLSAKLEKNKNRTWPDWKDVPRNKAIEHVRNK